MAGIWKCRCALRALACGCARYRSIIAAASAANPKSPARCAARSKPEQKSYPRSPALRWSASARGERAGDPSGGRGVIVDDCTPTEAKRLKGVAGAEGSNQLVKICLSGSSQNAHTAAPMTRRTAATMNGASQLPNCTKKPNTIGDSAPPILPAMFIMPETVPEYLPPVSIGTAHDGPMVHSKKNIEAVRQ